MRRKNKFVVFVTAPNEEEGVKIAIHLVENKIAACVNVVKNVRSIYFWEGKVQDDPEVLLVIKTLKKNFEKVKEEISKIHSYTVPEIIGFQLSKLSEKYEKWMEEVIEDSLV